MSKKPIRITIFNHKGGVGKTTLTVHIAHALADLGKKVMIVDTDPQCNLTSYLFEDSVVDDLLNSAESASGRTVWTAVKPIVDQTGELRVVRPHSVGSLQVIPGDIRLSDFEEFLGEAWTHCFQRRLGGFRAMGAISELIDKVAESRTDYVFYDAGPNIGPLNRALLLDTDAFIVPVACDLFSVRALKTLGQKLKQWIVDWQVATSLAPDGTSLILGAPTFIGFVPQRFKVYGQVMAKAPSLYLREIKRRMQEDIASVIAEVAPKRIPAIEKDYLFGEVKDFASLVQTAQREGVPIWDCSSTDNRQKEGARKTFEKIARNVVEKCKNLNPGKVGTHA
ncbi:MAG: ParA family protein [Planctomycetota bacterium]